MIQNSCRYTFKDLEHVLLEADVLPCILPVFRLEFMTWFDSCLFKLNLEEYKDATELKVICA